MSSENKLEYTEIGFCVPDKTPWAIYEEAVSRYAFASRYVRGKITLDVGCGNGYGCAILLSAGARKVIGGDINSKAVNYAKVHYAREGLDFLYLDAISLPFPNDYFDTIVCLETIEHVPEPRRLLLECKRVIRPGGLIICSTPNKAVYTVNRIKKPLDPFHIQEFYIQEFYNLLSEYFVDITLYGQRFMKSVEIIKHKSVMLAYFAGRKIFSFLPRGAELRHFTYYLISKGKNLFGKGNDYRCLDSRFEVLALPDDSSKSPLDVIAVAKVTKRVGD